MNKYSVSTSQFNGEELPCVRDDNGEIVAAGCTKEDAKLFASAPELLTAKKAHQEACRLISTLENDRKALLDFVEALRLYNETGRKDHRFAMESASEKLASLGL